MRYLGMTMALVLCTSGYTLAADTPAPVKTTETKKDEAKIEKKTETVDADTALSQLQQFEINDNDPNKVGLLFNRRSGGSCGATAGGFGYSWGDGGGCGSCASFGGYGSGGGFQPTTAAGIAVNGGFLMNRYSNGQGMIARLDAWDNMRFPQAQGNRYPGHRLETLSRIGVNVSGTVANVYAAGAYSAAAGFFRSGGPRPANINVSANAFANSSAYSSSSSFSNPTLNNFNSFNPTNVNNFNPSNYNNFRPSFNPTFNPTFNRGGGGTIFIP
jgi:hypothetical protein